MKWRLLVLPAIALSLACARAETPSVVMVVVDTLRADHLGAYGYERDTSPEIDRLARDGVLFEHAYATSPWTLPSFGSLFTGTLPAEHRAGARPSDSSGGKDFLPIRADLTTIAEALADQGMRTGAVINNAFTHPSFGTARGFQTYDHVAGNRKRIRRADQVVDRALEWLDEYGDSEFFLLLHFFDPHLKYNAPEGFRYRWSEPMADDERHELMDLKPLRQKIKAGEEIDWEFLVGAYDEEVAFVDQQVGRLFEALRRRGHLDRSIVLLTADHGEEFRDHGGFEHGHTLYDEVLRIPMIWWGPGFESGRRSEPASLIDVFPTVMEAIGQAAPFGLPGRSLLPSLSGGGHGPPRTLIAERTLYGPELETAISWPFKVIHEPLRRQARLFDLSADPGESLDIAHQQMDQTRRLMKSLQAYRRLAASVEGAEAAELDSETLETLKSLGYVD